MNWVLFTVSIDIITLGTALSIFVASIVCSLILALAYYVTRRRATFSRSLFSTIVFMAPISALVIMIVGNNIARAVGIGGGIALIRYRTTLENPMDLAYSYLSLAVGMACGLGLIGLAGVATLIMVLVSFLLWIASLLLKKPANMSLKILIPENLDFYGVFNDTLNTYCSKWDQHRIRTSDYGTLLELQYSIKLRDITKQKEFIDALRARNGNLNVTLTQRADEE